MSFKDCVTQIQVGHHHKHVPRQKCESIDVHKRSFNFLLLIIIIIIRVGGLPLGYLMLGISAKRSKSSNCSTITGHITFSQAVHSGFSSPSFRFFVSGCPASTGSFVGTSGRTGVSSLLVSSVSSSVAVVSALLASNEKNRLEQD
jgi:hypothetical protein